MERWTLGRRSSPSPATGLSGCWQTTFGHTRVTDDRDSVNKGLLQYFIVYQLGDGWYLNSAPILTVDWKADVGQNGRFRSARARGKLMFLGKLPLNVQAQAPTISWSSQT